MKQRQYLTGLGRGNSGYGLLDETHLYEMIDGSDANLLPLCKRGFNRDYGTGISIFRGNMGDLGLCEVCAQREKQNKPGLKWKRSRKMKKRIARLDKLDRYTPLLPTLPLKPDLNCFPHREEPVCED